MTAVGICHFGMAGESYHFADVSQNPAFEETAMSAAAALFDKSPSPFSPRLLEDLRQPASLYRPDIFHNWHWGHARYLLASAVVVLLPLFGADRSTGDQFEQMTLSWLAFCKTRREKPALLGRAPL